MPPELINLANELNILIAKYLNLLAQICYIDQSLTDDQHAAMDHDHYWKRVLLAATITCHMGFRLRLNNSKWIED